MTSLLVESVFEVIDPHFTLMTVEGALVKSKVHLSFHQIDQTIGNDFPSFLFKQNSNQRIPEENVINDFGRWGLINAPPPPTFFLEISRHFFFWVREEGEMVIGLKMTIGRLTRPLAFDS